VDSSVVAGKSQGTPGEYVVESGGRRILVCETGGRKREQKGGGMLHHIFHKNTCACV
jgi:hypothetical protein